MSTTPRFEVVHTDDGHTLRTRAANGAIVQSSGGQVYADRRGALCAIAVTAEVFGISMNRPPKVVDGYVTGSGPDGCHVVVRVDDVDEREVAS